MAWYKCIEQRKEGMSSKLNIYPNCLDNNSFLFFDNDDRFEVTYSGEPWTIQNLFTYEEQNMYSAPVINNSESTSVYIKNISTEAIYVRVVYKSSTEGNSYDYGSIFFDGRIIQTNIGGSISGITDFISLSPDGVLELKYQKDTTNVGGFDNVGMLLLELEE